jgi:hypothetical protein
MTSADTLARVAHLASRRPAGAPSKTALRNALRKLENAAFAYGEAEFNSDESRNAAKTFSNARTQLYALLGLDPEN